MHTDHIPIEVSGVVGHVATNIEVCRNFPVEPCSKLPREQLIELVTKSLATHRIVVLEGEPLSGKSECLAELMRRAPNTSIGVFLNPDMGIFNSPSYLRLVVAEQVSLMLDGVPLSDEGVTEEAYRHLLYRLQRKSKNQRITWLVDGLLVGMSGQERSALLKLLPFGFGEFDFVVTGEPETAGDLCLYQEKPKVVPVFPVGIEEATSFFSDLGLANNVVHELRCFSSGNIGQMQKLRRFVSAGLSLDGLLSEHKPTLESLFEFEWKSIPESDDLRKALAYVVFSNKPATVAEIATFVGKSHIDTSQLIESCRVLSIDEDSQIVSVESRAQRFFVRSRLANYETMVRSHVITTLMENPASKETTVYLPSELLTAGRHDELIRHLGPSHFLSLLETEKSLHSIRRHAGFGIDAARALHNDTAELALSLIRSAATGLTFSIGFDSQIEALVKLGATEQALGLASMAPTTEERLHVLSIAANTLHQNGQVVPTEIKDQVRTLSGELSFEDLGELGVEIACNLLPVDFDMATEIVRRVLDGARKRIDAVRNEEISSNLAPLAGSADEGGEVEVRRSLDLLSHDQARRFANCVATTVERFSFERILAFVKPIEPANKIMVLAQWLRENRDHLQVFQVAEHALDIVLGEVSRAPRLSDLREIAEVLPYLKNHDERDALAKKIEAQIGLLGHQGTSEDYCRLWLLIYRVRFVTEPAQVELSLIDLFAEIQALKEISVQVTCWTWMLFHLNQYENSQSLEKDVALISEVSAQLSKAIDALLDGTANHFLVARPVIAALAQTQFDKAEKLVERLNTQASRDKGYEELVRNLVFGVLDAPRLEMIDRSVRRIRNDDIRGRSVISLLQVALRRVEKGSGLRVLRELGELWSTLRIAPGRLQAHVLSTRIQLRENSQSVDLPEVTKIHVELWNQIMVESVQVEIGYWIASEFSSDDPSLARDWLTRTIEYANKKQAPSDTFRSALAATISLATRVFPYVDDSGVGFSRIRSLIQEMRTTEAQLQLWTRLGLRLYYAERQADAKKVVSEYVEPILNQSYADNELIFDSLVSYSAPLLYLVHPATATQAISRMGNDVLQDHARVNICDVIFRKCPVGEPFDSRNSFEYSIDQAAVADVLAVFKDIRTDSAIMGVVEDLCLSIGSDKNRSKIPRTAAINFLETLENLVSQKLPDSTNIQHDGYLIACNAYILRARYMVMNSSVQRPQWKVLYDQARGISNVADRVVVAAMVGSCAHGARGNAVIGDWIADIRADLALIPSDQDRVDRHDWVARIVGAVDKGACRGLVSDAMRLIVQLPETDDLVRRQRSLLDLANTVDTKLADRLIELNDTDEARQARLKIEKERRSYRLTIARNPSAGEIGKMSDHELADACRDNLARLNSGRISARSIHEFRLFQARASKMSIVSASAVWHFVLESSLRKRKADRDTDFASRLFDATCKAAEVVCGLIGKVFSGTDQSKTLEVGIVRNGEREMFLEQVVSWGKTQSNQIIRISDPYFGPDDVALIRAICSHASNTKFRILTSKECVRRLDDVAEAFESAWRELSDDVVPEMTVVVMGLGSQGKHPIHDRWIVSDIGGLRLGTSVHSMGGLRTSEISGMSADEAANARNEIDELLVSPPREIHGERLSVVQYSI